MKPSRSALALTLLLTGLLAVEPAFAWRGGHRGHSGVRLGIVIGAPIVGWHAFYPRPYYYPAYYPAYYPPVVVQPQPSVYIEQQAPQPAANYWYYCAGSRAYYPYVKECPGGWQRVAPQPQGG